MAVLVLTAMGEEVDKVRGLRLGADDYVTKPFGLMELLARVEALLRRRVPSRSTTAPESPIDLGDVRLDPASRAVTRAGRTIELAPKEYDLLLALARRDGAVATRLELIRDVWGYAGATITRTVDTHVSELRRKLESDPGQPQLLLTVRKVGYRIATPERP